jgi:tetratricopeptide (TPR) repeat protein
MLVLSIMKTEPWLSFTIQYIDCGRPADAAEAFKRAIELQKSHVKAWNNLGLLYENQGINKILLLLVICIVASTLL